MARKVSDYPPRKVSDADRVNLIKMMDAGVPAADVARVYNITPTWAYALRKMAREQEQE
jgi:hypothetical protein